MGMDRVDSPCRHHFGQRHRLGRAFSVQPGAHLREQVELGFGRSLRVIGNIVRRSREAVIGHNRRAMLGAKQEARHRKILVSVILARSKVGYVCHRPAAACARPFHMPPRPRMCCQADSKVQPA